MVEQRISTGKPHLGPDNAGFFIIGTDTDVGKTVITASLLRAFLKAGYRARAVKPVQSGGLPARAPAESAAPDVNVYRAASSPSCAPDPLYCFATPCSPHLAADLEDRPMDGDALITYCKDQLGRGDVCLFEGAGGLMTPLTHGETYLDVLRILDLPVILVAENKLGMINHTLLTLEVMESAGLTPAALVVNYCKAPLAETTGQMIQQGNIDYLRERFPDLSIIVCPHKKGRGWNGSENPFLPELVHLTSFFKKDSLVSLDREHVWHPYSSVAKGQRNHLVHRALGNYLFGENGPLLDGMASWWCAVHGYGDPGINKAAARQISRMSHVMFGGITHEPALKLAKMLIGLMPEGLTRFFYCDSGSVSVEVALKMAIQYWQGRGIKNKRKILTVRGGYHGDTFGAMSVCDPENGMHHLFSGILPKQIFAEKPGCRFDAPFDPGSLDHMSTLLERHAHEVAAVILEPIVQGAGGMWFYHPEYLKGVRALCDRWGVLMICDEIATGFGRTGKMFAVEWAGISPDILCMGKGLTGGYLSFAVTAATEAVAAGVCRGGAALMHGPTYMGNPLACAVCCESLEKLVQSPWQQRIRSIESALARGLTPCRHHPGVADVRVLGAIGVVETLEPVNQERCREFFIQEGVWIRPFGRLVYVMPPYTLSEEEVGRLTKAIRKLVEKKAYL